MKTINQKFNFTLIIFCGITAMLNAQNWENAGVFPVNYPEYGNVSGRIWAMDVSKGQNQTMYICPEGGGIWKSSNFITNNPVWANITDETCRTETNIIKKECLNNVRQLAIDRNNNIYALGLSSLNNQKIIFKSNNGGKAWQSILSGANIIKFILDENANVIYSVTSNGILYRCDMDGQNKITITKSFSASQVFDMSYRKVNNIFTLFLSIINANTGIIEIWKSDVKNTNNWDWSRVPFAINDKNTVGATINFSDINTVGSITFATNGDNLYAAGHGMILAVLFKFDQNAFIQTPNQDLQIPGPNQTTVPFNTQFGWVFEISQNGHLYIGTTHDVIQSFNQASSWTKITYNVQPALFQRPHVDHHAMAFYNGMLYDGNDGGIYRFIPKNDGTAGQNKWENLNTGSLRTALANGSAIDPNNPSTVLVGTQDNGLEITRNGVSSVQKKPGSLFPEYGMVKSDKAGKYAYYTGVAEWNSFGRYDFINNTMSDVSPKNAVPNGTCIGWYKPFAIDPNNDNRLVLGYTIAYETQDGAQTWDGDNNPINLNPIFDPSMGANCGGTAIEYGNDGTIWMAVQAQDNLFHKINNVWETIDTKTNMSINAICPDRENNNLIYFATRNGVFNYTRVNNIDNFVSIGQVGNNLPSNLAIFSMEYIVDTDLDCNLNTHGSYLFIGTNDGVYFTNLSLQPFVWHKLDGLPTSNIKSIIYYPTSNLLLISMYGRSAYKINLKNVFNKMVDYIQEPKKLDILIRYDQGDPFVPYNKLNLCGSTGGDFLAADKEIKITLNHPAIQSFSWEIDYECAQGDVVCLNNPNVIANDGKNGTGTLPGQYFLAYTPPIGAKLKITFNVKLINGCSTSFSKTLTTLSFEQILFDALICKLKHMVILPYPHWDIINPLENGKFLVNPITRIKNESMMNVIGEPLFTVFNTRIFWSVNDMIQSPIEWTGELMPNMYSEEFSLGEFEVEPGQDYVVKVWVNYTGRVQQNNTGGSTIDTIMSFDIETQSGIFNTNPTDILTLEYPNFYSSQYSESGIYKVVPETYIVDHIINLLGSTSFSNQYTIESTVINWTVDGINMPSYNYTGSIPLQTISDAFYLGEFDAMQNRDYYIGMQAAVEGTVRTYSSDGTNYTDSPFSINTDIVDAIYNTGGPSDKSISIIQKTHTDLVLYPNPTSGIFHLLFPTEIEGVINISIYDMLGNEILVITNMEQVADFDISELNRGVYFARISFNNQIINKRIILN